MLTVDEMVKIAQDVLAKRPISVPGEEALDFSKDVAKDMAAITAQGGAIDFPRD